MQDEEDSFEQNEKKHTDTIAMTMTRSRNTNECWDNHMRQTNSLPFRTCFVFTNIFYQEEMNTTCEEPRPKSDNKTYNLLRTTKRSNVSIDRCEWLNNWMEPTPRFRTRKGDETKYILRHHDIGELHLGKGLEFVLTNSRRWYTRNACCSTNQHANPNRQDFSWKTSSPKKQTTPIMPI